LLLQLVQTSAHDVRIDAKKIEKLRQNSLALRRQESFSESQPAPPEPFLNENDHEVHPHPHFKPLVLIVLPGDPSVWHSLGICDQGSEDNHLVSHTKIWERKGD